MNDVYVKMLLDVVPMEGEDGELFPSLHLISDIEKFVELIVRECAAVALRESHEPSECILNHFGIE